MPSKRARDSLARPLHLGSCPGSRSDRRREMELCARIDEARHRWDVLKHPFYERWECGELTGEELAFYAGEYRHAVVALARAAQPAASDGAAAWWPEDRFRALAVLYAIESAQPAISRTKLAGLAEHYGFDADDPPAAYFRPPADLDVEHARAAREALAEAPPARVAELAAAAERALEANWRLLDGVERAPQPLPPTGASAWGA